MPITAPLPDVILKVSALFDSVISKSPEDSIFLKLILPVLLPVPMPPKIDAIVIIHSGNMSNNSHIVYI